MGLTAKWHNEEVTESPQFDCMWQPKDTASLAGIYDNSFFKIQNLMFVQIMNTILVVFLEDLLSVALLQMYSS